MSDAEAKLGKCLSVNQSVIDDLNQNLDALHRKFDLMAERTDQMINVYEDLYNEACAKVQDAGII